MRQGGGMLGSVLFVAVIALIVVWIFNGLNKPSDAAPKGYATTPAGNPVDSAFKSAPPQAAANTSQQTGGGNSPQNSTTLNPVDAGFATMAANGGAQVTAVVVAKDTGQKVGAVETFTGEKTLAANACVDYDPASDSVTGADWTIKSADGRKARSYTANGGAVLHAKYPVTIYFTPCNNDPKSL